MSSDGADPIAEGGGRPERLWPEDPEERLVAMVHDLRTPLAIVQGFAELMLRRGDDLPAEERDEFLRRMLEALAEMREILDTERAQRQG